MFILVKVTCALTSFPLFFITPVRSKYFPQHFVFNDLFSSSFRVKQNDHVANPYKATGKNILMYHFKMQHI